MTNTGKFLKDMPSWAKGIVAIGTIAIVYFTARSVIKGLKAKKNEKDAKGLTTASTDEMSKLKKAGIIPTITNVQAEAIATQIQTAVNWNTTNEESIYRAFRSLKNEADLYLLIKVYGIRKYIDYGLFYYPVYQYNLQQAISEDMDTNEIAKINKILSDKKINFKF